MSFLALPVFEAMRAAGADRPPSTWRGEGDLQLWGLRILSGGIVFLAAVFLVGRAGEAVAAGAGALAAVGFGLGTLAGGLAATTFGHVAAGLFGFAAFVLAWQAGDRRSVFLAAAAGACAGVGILFEYQEGLIGGVVF